MIVTVVAHAILVTGPVTSIAETGIEMLCRNRAIRLMILAP